MKSSAVCCALALCALLGGCKMEQTQDAAAAVQAHYAALPAATLQAEVTVDVGDSLFTYTLDYAYDADGADTQTILAPESVAGIALRITGELGQEITLQYADTVLDFGLVAGNGCSPADGLFYLLHDLAYATPTEVGTDTIGERDVITLKYEGIDDLQGIARAVWLDAQTYAPVAAEIYCNNTRILTYIVQSVVESAT